MGAFNTLLVTLTCENCHHKQQEKMQFKFGDTWQFIYHIGDRLTWGGNDQGRPGIPLVKVWGFLEAEHCSRCSHPYFQDYDIMISYDIIRSVKKAERVTDYFETDDDWCAVVD